MATKAKEQSELIELREIVRRTGRTAEWIKEKSRTGAFALPLTVVDRTTLWRREHIEPWILTGAFPPGTPFQEGEGQGRRSRPGRPRSR